MKPWNLKQLIQERVNREAFLEVELETPPLPKFQKPKVVRNSVGWWNFTKQTLSALRP